MPQTNTPLLDSFLERVHIMGAGPIKDLTIEFQDPVTVVAGPTGIGKTTLLLAASSAYNQSHPVSSGLHDILLPRRLQHPIRLPEGEDHLNPDANTSLTFTYTLNGTASALTVKLQNHMDRSQSPAPMPRPMNPTYIRTMGHLSSIPETAPDGRDLPAHAALVMNRVLVRDYTQVRTQPARREQKELVALHPNGSCHRQPHMSYGEHMAARLAYDLTRLKGGLALIDNVESGLDPSGRRALVKELTRLSKDNGTQFIVTTHCPEVMASAPPCGRIFLEPAPGGHIRAVRDRY